MTKEKSQGNEFSAIGKQTMARAYSAMDYYFDHLKKNIASAPTGGTEFGEKVKACAEQNISATQEFVRELSYANDIQDVLRIQMEFMRSQLEAFGEHGQPGVFAGGAVRPVGCDCRHSLAASDSTAVEIQPSERAASAAGRLPKIAETLVALVASDGPAPSL
jgi:hypothetical protein